MHRYRIYSILISQRSRSKLLKGLSLFFFVSPTALLMILFWCSIWACVCRRSLLLSSSKVPLFVRLFLFLLLLHFQPPKIQELWTHHRTPRRKRKSRVPFWRRRRRFPPFSGREGRKGKKFSRNPRRAFCEKKPHIFWKGGVKSELLAVPTQYFLPEYMGIWERVEVGDSSFSPIASKNSGRGNKNQRCDHTFLTC